MAGKIADFLNGVAKGLDSKQVKVGFIDKATYPDGTSVAMVAAINEYGNPGNNQLPRPFFRNAISEHSTEWADAVGRGIRAGLPVNNVLEVVGAQIQGDVKQSIASLMEPKLSATTLHIRRSRKVMPNKSDKPLVDTRVMIGDVNYEVGEIESSQNS
ncbi:hypothetical protein LU631_02700 [Erwinia tracheiphila]|uniref:Phage protein n=1 Tax=Erwinia tracheiphila TaxID=65700 RepID=A0A0M2KDJ1_9GAMM|nr:hypothetical protein [Erwinia tracheiphila]EOS94710.1 hypothetical protein ETR_12068 [Erwinia tracheiphila PSU-1]KKF37009.1 hypothetical protein SY86_18770 [Erwinia tracheiphila]UIA88357.1 hypothetical protein LU631_02700 [Erwinia tracheiphila]UIA96222.1 hypothetical protein LU633_23460 [Erwinia tracheiphila]